MWAQAIDKLTQSSNVFSQSTKGVQGEQSGISTNNVGRLWMWSNQKMKSKTFIHNDDIKCFHVVVQRTHKHVVMGCINFKDHALIKRPWENEKMNVMNRMFKDEKK